MKILKLSFFFGFLFILFSCGESKNKYDSEGNKHGKWVEYLNEDGTKEVSVDSVKYIRDITYFHGMPAGQVIDHYPSGKIQSEFSLVSGPYRKNESRPKDKYLGFIVWFDEETSKIKEFSYHDSNGDIDIGKLMSVAIANLKLDPRFDTVFLAKNYPVTYNLYNSFNKTLKIIKKAGITIDQYVLFYNSQQKKSNNNTSINNQQYINPSNENLNNSNINQNSRTNSDQNIKKKCRKCNGTGRCQSCKGPFKVHYWDSRSGGWKDQNETRPGFKICTTCSGAGVIYGSWNYNVNPPQRLTKPCNVCHDGWVFCEECNPSGHGEHLGECENCRGTGFSNY